MANHTEGSENDRRQRHRAKQSSAQKTYALVSHESAVEAIWALAARKWEGVLDDECIWLVPAPQSCVRTQGDIKRLAQEVDLDALGIRRRPIDLLVPDKSCYSRGRLAKYHVWTDTFPLHSFVRVHDRVLVSTPYFVLFQLAMSRRQNGLARVEAEETAFEDALLHTELGIEGRALSTAELMRWGNISSFARAAQVLCDFMGTYRYVPQLNGEDQISGPRVEFQTQPLVTPDALRDYIGEMSRERGVIRARQVADAAFANAASPMETTLALVLTLPVGMGGFGLPRPDLNSNVPLSSDRYDLLSQDTIIGDLVWAEKRLVVEYYGWDEHFGAGPKKVASDAARANTLSTLGWTVLHATYEQIRTLQGMSLLARQVAEVLGAPLVEPSELERVWRVRLLAQLLPKTNRDL